LRRTTAAVNYFKIMQGKGDANTPKEEETSEPQQKKRRSSDISEENTTNWTAKATHAVIAKDNESLRSNEEETVVEKTFEIQVDDPICKMRDDTQLVLVDIPGINEADSSKKYKDFVETKWNTFDCVVLVMDAIQGVNTQEQVELLKFVASNNKKHKHVPTIILGNKVDDPEDREKMVLVKEARTKCTEIFGERCEESALKEILHVAENYAYVKENTTGAIFIPVSAMNAFLYRKAAHLTPETFHLFDEDLMDKIGKDEVGRQWKNFSTQQKVETIQKAIGDTDAFKERLADTNFDKFLTVLDYFIGGKEAQIELIKSQIMTLYTQVLANDEVSIAKTVRDMYRKQNALGLPTNGLNETFWNVYTKRETVALETVKEKVDPSLLQVPFQELEAYYKFAKSMDWKDETTITLDKMKSLLRQQLSLVISKENEWQFDDFHKECRTIANFNWCAIGGCSAGYPKGCGRSCKKTYGNIIRCGRHLMGSGWHTMEIVTWKCLSPLDWKTLLYSVLLPSSELEFYMSFGIERQILEEALQNYRSRYHSKLMSEESVTSEEWDYIEACRTKQNLENNESPANLKMPAELSDPSHWGYLGWKYVKFCRAQERTMM
jgi:signal recognition particle receptor subunit beta